MTMSPQCPICGAPEGSFHMGRICAHLNGSPNLHVKPRVLQAPESVARALRLAGKWAERFGFGNYRLYVTAMPEKFRKHNSKGRFADVDWDHMEEYITLRIYPDHMLTEQVTEQLVVHEMTHVLLDLMKDHRGEETICNRVAKLLLGPSTLGPREYRDLHYGGKHKF